jgi:hypothetical protein
MTTLVVERLSNVAGAEIADVDLSQPPEAAHAHPDTGVTSHSGDLVMWDNRCLLHRAVRNYAMATQRRILQRTVVKGTKPF